MGSLDAAGSQFGFDLLDGWQTAFEFFGKLFQMPEFGDAHGRAHVAERVFDNQLLFRFAENQADAGLVGGVLEKIVYRREVEVHFAGVLRFERAALKVDHDEAAKLEVVEEKVQLVAFTRNVKRVLAADKGKADTQL